MSVKLQIYVLCRDRPEYAIKSIESVIKSADSNTEVIVSDNSETDLVERICLERFPDVQYIRRSSPRTSEAHFKAILEEAIATFLVLFHDDDIMHPDYVSTMLPYMQSNPEISALGCNAEFINKVGDFTANYCLKDLNAPIFFLRSNQFLVHYLVGNVKSTGIAPFPSYMYRRKYLSNCFLNYAHGGKYSDLTFLLKILKKAPIVWIPDSLIYYRSHGGNDSAVESIPSRLSLIRYLIKNEGVDRKSFEMISFKFTYWLNWWKSTHTHKSFYFFKPNGWREATIFRFLVFKSIHFILQDYHFRRAIIRKVVKLINSRFFND